MLAARLAGGAASPGCGVEPVTAIFPSMILRTPYTARPLGWLLVLLALAGCDTRGPGRASSRRPAPLHEEAVDVGSLHRVRRPTPVRPRPLPTTSSPTHRAAPAVAAARVRHDGRPALPQHFVDTEEPAVTGRTITVRDGDDLQARLDAAHCGDLILLDADAVFTRNIKLPAKRCDGWISLRTDTPLPPPGRRMTPAEAGSLAKIISPNANPALTTAPGAHHYRISGVELSVQPGVKTNYGIVQLGLGTESSVEQLPHHIVLDRIYVHGQAALNVSRCVALNDVESAIIDSYLSECHGKGFDTQGVGGWNGPGPFKIDNNYIEGAGQNIMFGGADSRIPNLVPSDIVISRNHLFKPLAWMPDRTWTVKNTLELKNAQRVLIEGNVLENCWSDAQSGFAIVMFSVNQRHGAPWSTVQDITIRNNTLHNVTSGMNISAGDSDATPAARFLITNNLIDELGAARLTPNGRGNPGGVAFSVLHGPDDVTIEHNTAAFAATGAKRSALFMDYGMGRRFALRNNLLEKGIITSGNGGIAALNMRFQEWDVSGNVFAGAPPRLSPPNNTYPAALTAVPLRDATARDVELSGASAYRGKATDGNDIGVDWAALKRAQAGVVGP